MDSFSPDAAPAVLIDLIAAGLVSHELIGDPAQLGSEVAALRALCDLVAGPVYRLGPFHYAFRAGTGDLGGRLGETAPEGWTDALAAALGTAFGPDAIWINATDLVPTREQGPDAGLDQRPDPALEAPLVFLRAQGAAVAAGLRAGEPGMRAVIDAAYAVDCARITAAADPGAALDARLTALEAEIEARVAAGLAALAAPLAALTGTLAVVLQRLDAQADVLHGHIAREEGVAARLDAFGAGAEAFEERLGLSLAEFLARLEQSGAVAPARGLAAAPQVS